MTRAPSRGTSGTPSSRWRGGSACPRPVPARAPPRPTGTSPPGCPRAGAGTGWSRWRAGSRRAPHDLFDPLRLRVRVVLDVLPRLPGELPLRAQVELAVRLVGTEVVAEAQHPRELAASGGEHVEADARIHSLEQPVLEPVGLADAQDVPGRLEWRDIRALVRRVGDLEVD